VQQPQATHSTLAGMAAWGLAPQSASPIYCAVPVSKAVGWHGEDLGWAQQGLGGGATPAGVPHCVPLLLGMPTAIPLGHKASVANTHTLHWLA